MFYYYDLNKELLLKEYNLTKPTSNYKLVTFYLLEMCDKTKCLIRLMY